MAERTSSSRFQYPYPHIMHAYFQDKASQSKECSYQSQTANTSPLTLCCALI